MRSILQPPRALLAASSLLGLIACSDGPGRRPESLDGGVIEDARPFDATSFDGSAFDTGVTDGTIGLPDAMPRGTSSFTGVFGILNAQEALYAREVHDRLNLVIGAFPYDYIGTISSAGMVDVSSQELTRSGCARARVTGSYDRASGTYLLLHETCNSQGAPLSSTIRGGFVDDFDRGRSGIYDLRATVRANPGNCYVGPAENVLVRYAFSFLRSGAMAVFTAEDLIPTPAHYEGAASSDGSFSAIQRIDASATTEHVAMSGRFEQLTTHDPVRFSGLRDAWDPIKRCAFTITLEGVRIAEF